MKKALSKTFIIVGSIVAALAITVLVLCLVRVKPLENLSGYTRVEVYDFNSVNRIEIEKNDEKKADRINKLEDGMDKASFSVMQGILEGKPSGALKYKTEVKEGEKEKSRVTYQSTAIESINSTDTLYKLTFVYSEVKTVKVEGEEVKFDRAIVLVGDANNEIGNVEIVFYLTSRIDNEATDENLSSEYYTVSPVLVNARSTALYNAIAEVLDSFK